jgi:CRISPR-associated exonuclease Cas4
VPIAVEVEDGLIPLSALQHFLFCPRQCALIHVEGLWAEDAATAQGQLLHEKADGGRPGRRPGVRIARAVMLRSVALGVSGTADVVEFHAPDGQPFPVEYKRGKPIASRGRSAALCPGNLSGGDVRAPHAGGRAVLRGNATAYILGLR